MAIIIGIDPGTRVTGYGVISVDGDDLLGLECGIFSLPEREPLARRLHQLATQLGELFQRHQPSAVVIERIFLGRNADSAFKLGHARGVCLQAATAAGVEVFEYAARHVKKAVTGSGAAEKEHVKLIVENLLGIRTEFLDASDALALAVTHARSLQTHAILKGALQEIEI